ncbi:hypothetical protein ACP70R_034004 [Stipagrostis hirtigluma subsp. patula]
MDAADATATPFGAWASIRGYFTPATLFLFVNLVIGTIALTSRASQNRRRRDYYQYDGDGHPHHQDPHQQQPQGYHYYGHHEQQYVTPPAPAPLARTSSVLDRLRSIGLYRFRSGDFPPEYGAAAAGANHTQDVFPPVEEETTKQAQAHYARSQSEPAPAREEKRPGAATRMKKSGSEVRKAQAVRAPARVVEAVAEDDTVDARAEEFIGSFRRELPPQRAEHHYQEEYVPPVRQAPAPLARTPSVLERLRSLDIYGFLAPAQPAAAAPAPARDAAFATPADEKKQQAAYYGRSRSEPKWEQGKEKKQQQGADGARMAKSSSVARKPAARSLAAAADDCVDARAEAFIDSFRREYVAPTPTPPQQQAHHDEDDHVVPPPAPPPLARTPSVMERLRSFGLYRFRSGDLGPELPAADEKAHAHYDRSRSEPAKKGKKQGAEARMSKSSSESIVEQPETEACVDERADDFINKFRQQLQLQRLNSLLNYKEVLNRGGGKQQ